MWGHTNTAINTGPATHGCVALGKLVNLSESQFGFIRTCLLEG